CERCGRRYPFHAPQSAGPMDGHRSKLYWSRRGEVACPDCAPIADFQRWTNDGWKPLTAQRNNVKYQCQYCHGGPLRHAPSAPVPSYVTSATPHLPARSTSVLEPSYPPCPKCGSRFVAKFPVEAQQHGMVYLSCDDCSEVWLH